MKRLLFVLVMLGLLAAGTAYWISSSNNGGENGYTFESVKYGSMTDLVNATGIVKPREVALVFPRLPGIVEEIYGRVGQKVAKGDPLFKLNSEMAQRSLERAQAALERTKKVEDAAKTGWEKIKLYVDKGHGSEKELLEAQIKHAAATEGVKEAESALKQAQLAMEWTTVKALIAGVIIEKNLYIGQPVGLSAGAGGGGSSSGTAAAVAGPGGTSGGSSTTSLFGMTEPRIPFMIAADLGDLEVYAQITQSDIGRLRAGLQARFTVDAFPDEPAFEGEVTEVHMMPVNVLGTNLYPAVIRVANRRVEQPDQKPGQQGDWLLRPVMTVNVDITRDTHSKVWKLPSAAANLQLDEHLITQAARQKLATRQSLKNPDDWVVVWIMGNEKKPWPIFARVGGKNKQGKPGIKEANYAEVLEWDKELDGKLDPNKEPTYPELIIATPPPKLSIFERGTPFKIS
jgi:HlyD family secretion protein